jgi:uncharacterized protein
MIVNVKHIKKNNIHLVDVLLGSSLPPAMGEGQDELASFLSKEVEFEVDVTSSGKGVLVQGRLATTLTPICDRCLEGFNLSISPLFAVNLYPQNGKKTKKNPQDDIVNEVADTYCNHEIDLKPLLWEQIVLASPNWFICREKCLGLCQTCGINLNEGSCQCESSEEHMTVFSNLMLPKKSKSG